MEEEKEVKYKNEMGKPIEHYPMDLIDFLQGLLSRFEDLFNIGMGAEDQFKDALVNTGLILVHDADREAEEVCDMIEKQIGTIEIDYRQGRYNPKLGITFNPAEKTQEIRESGFIERRGKENENEKGSEI